MKIPTKIKTLISDRLFLIIKYKINRCLVKIVFARSSRKIVFLSRFKTHPNLPCLVQESKSQFLQDVVALHYSDYKKRGGYFVEVGAGDGTHMSNTVLLEKNYEWVGILVEPNKSQYDKILKTRSCHFSNKIVYSESDIDLIFNETFHECLSTTEDYLQSDGHVTSRIDLNILRSYSVKTISLVDLLDTYQSPKFIDFLSLDTEGMEYSILSTFNFDIYKIKFICVEHNFTENRSRIFKLLTTNGYKRIYESISDVDDWYLLDI